MKKRIFSAALAGCMMLTMVPVTAFAAEEGVTEVAVEQYADEANDANNATIHMAKTSDELRTYQAPGGKRGVDFYQDGKLLPVVDYQAFYANEVTTPATNTQKASRGGYYLPLIVKVPNGSSSSKVTSILGESADASNPDLRTDKVMNILTDDDNEIHLLVQVARLDGEIFSRTVKLEISVKGDWTDKQVLEYDLRKEISPDMLSKTSKYDTKELEISKTTNTMTLGGVSGAASVFYNADSKTVLKASDNCYYLPLHLDLDSNNAKVELKDPVTALTVTNKTVDFLVKVADENGKRIRDNVEVEVYPQGKSEGAEEYLPHRTLTYPLNNVTLAKEAVTVGAVLPDVAKMVSSKVSGYLNYQQNIEKAVKSLEMKDGVVVITVDKSALAPSDSIPVLFTMTENGRSVIGAQPSVVNYGGVNGTHQWVSVALNSGLDGNNEATVNITNVSGVTRPVTYRVVDASKVPVLEDSTVKVENGTMTGLIAAEASKAKTAADVKAMYKVNGANGGTVTVTTPAGIEMKDNAAVGTGCLIVLKNSDGKIIDTITIVVKGDVNGTGVMGLSQLLTAAKAMKGSEALEGAYFKAGDMDGNGKIGLNDMLMMAKLLK